MKIVDLTHLIQNKMTLYPGTDKPIIDRKFTIEEHHFRELELKISTHTGTHIDSPAHMELDGKTLDQMPIEQFIGLAILIDISNDYNEKIELELIKLYEKDILNSDFVIFKTGWEKYWNTKDYFNRFPTLSLESTKWLVKQNIKGIGIDAISVDSIDSENFENHHEILTQNNMIIIENLTNLKKLPTKFTLSVLPLKIQKADGSPVRAIASW